jgi:hypothetical protein
MKTIISLFIIVALFSPFITGKGISLEILSDIDSIDNQKKGEIENLISEQVKLCITETAKAEIMACLKENSIEDGQISIITDINDEGSIIIKEAVVKIKSRYTADIYSLSQNLVKKWALK